MFSRFTNVITFINVIHFTKVNFRIWLLSDVLTFSHTKSYPTTKQSLRRRFYVLQKMPPLSYSPARFFPILLLASRAGGYHNSTRFTRFLPGGQGEQPCGQAQKKPLKAALSSGAGDNPALSRQTMKVSMSFIRRLRSRLSSLDRQDKSCASTTQSSLQTAALRKGWLCFFSFFEKY